VTRVLSSLVGRN